MNTKLKFLISSFWAVPIILIVRLLRPFKIIRFGSIRSERIGHFIMETQEQVSLINDSGHNIMDLYWIRRNTSNEQWRKMVCRSLPVYNWTEWLDRWNRYIPGGKIHTRPSTFCDTRDLDGKILNCPIKLSFTKSEDNFCKDWLRSKGWNGKQAFACFIIRDSSFLKEDECFNSFYAGKADTAYHSHRDSDLEDFIPAMEWLAERGVLVLRMGKIMKERLRSPVSGIIDYAFLTDKSDLLDIWLFAHCMFCVSTGTGIDTASFVYNRPILMVNVLPFCTEWFTSPVTMIPKKLVWNGTGKSLTLKEHLEYVYFRKEEYESKGIDINGQSREEILEDVSDFYLRKVEKSKRESDKQQAIQQTAWEVIKVGHTFSSYHRWIHHQCEMGPRWLERQEVGFLPKFEPSQVK